MHRMCCLFVEVTKNYIICMCFKLTKYKNATVAMFRIICGEPDHK
jgi:hypothetical protein